jgi:Domain of unknown function (DUF4263)
MKMKGAIEALCFVEIKAHTTLLLQNSLSTRRLGSFGASGRRRRAGAANRAECARRLGEKVEPTTDDGEPTGETLFVYQPKCFLVVGQLDELRSDRGIHIEKYRSFELYRRHTHRPEIITFDELLHRARFIVEHVDT